MSISKYIASEPIEIQRSEINLARYNPRKITEEAKKLLKANIKRLGVMGGIVWNETTGRLVGGHQKIKILDELHKYDPFTGENDYTIRVERVKLSDKEEREQNIFLNNKNAQGEYDRDLLGTLLNDIDYKLAGLDDYDLNLAGVKLETFDFDELDEKPQELEIKKSAQTQNKASESNEKPSREEMTPEEKKADIKAKKEAIAEKQFNNVKEGETYVMLSFDTYESKAEFMRRFDLDPMENIIHGETFADSIEVIY